MGSRYRQSTYGQQIDSAAKEVDRLTEINARTGRRGCELEHARRIARGLTDQMRRLGKRRSSGFYGLEELSL